MGQFLDNVQHRLKTSTTEVLTFVFKLFSGSFLGLTFALIGEEMLGYGPLSFVFVMVSVLFAFMKIAKNWNAMSVLIFNLVCVLIGLLLRMYVLIAPGA